MAMATGRGKILLGGGVILAAGLTALLVLSLRRQGVSLPSAQLADGRILRIEGVTFGAHHEIGQKSRIEKIGFWLPRKLIDWLSPKYPYSEINLDRPALVLWVNAFDPVKNKFVDCQGIRVAIVAENGDVFAEETSSWFGSPTFWRVGHVFHAFPATDRILKVQVTPWRTNVTATFGVQNPHVTEPSIWTAHPLPQHQLVGELDIGLTGLLLRTNGNATNYWETPIPYLLPIWELRRDGQLTTAWEQPEWTAEDPVGNRSKYVGIHQASLRFFCKFYPSPTNSESVVVLGSSSPVNIDNLQSNLWWNLKFPYEQHDIEVLGLFTNGTHIFSEGEYLTNPTVKMGPVIGGAPSGWVGQSQRVSPTKVKLWEGHYTPVPVIYVRVSQLQKDQRLAVRLRDDQGGYWIAEPESQGNSQGIKPFLVRLPPEVKNVVAEFVVLKPAEAEFLVEVPRE